MFTVLSATCWKMETSSRTHKVSDLLLLPLTSFLISVCTSLQSHKTHRDDRDGCWRTNGIVRVCRSTKLLLLLFPHIHPRAFLSFTPLLQPLQGLCENNWVRKGELTFEVSFLTRLTFPAHPSVITGWVIPNFDYITLLHYY